MPTSRPRARTLKSAVVAILWCSALTTHAGMPTSGSCAFMMTLPVPYGATVTSFGGLTGYNLLGRMTFTSATTGSFSGRIVNPTFQTNNSPYISAGGIIDLESFPMSIEPLSAGNGFTGGYKMTATGRVGGNAVFLEWTAVPNNNGKSILMVSSGVGTASDPRLGPGSGVCQF